jgi:endonuclease YncB( thermonuclease family)
MPKHPRARIVAVAAILLATPLHGCIPRDSAQQTRAYDGAATVALTRITFEDGDTFKVDSTHIRVLGIDTPEVRNPHVGILIDQPYGPAASESTRVWLTRAGRIEIVNDGRDRYGRQLAHVFVDGDLLAERLLWNGLAYETVSHYGDSGFPDLADRILRAADKGPKPKFQQPYRWRKKNQIRN